jgi:hypothetical protein
MQVSDSFKFSPIERTSFLLPSVTLVFSMCVWFAVRGLNGAEKTPGAAQSLIEFLEDFATHATLTLILVGLCMVMLIFVVAHILDTLSTTIYERFLHDSLQGFPHERIVPRKFSTKKHRALLKLRKVRLWPPRFLNEGVKVIIFWSFVLILLEITCRNPYVLNELTVIKYQGVELLSHADKIDVLFWSRVAIRLEIAFVLVLLGVPYFYRGFVREPGDRRFLWLSFFNRSNPVVMFLVKWLIYKWARVSEIVKKILKAFFRLEHSIDRETFFRVEHNLRALSGIEFRKLQTNDRFWLVYISLVERSKSSASNALENWKKAEFCRNQALALMLATFCFASSYQIGQPPIQQFFSPEDLSYVAFACFFASLFFCYRFYQYYYSFSKLVFRAFASLAIPAPVKVDNDTAVGTAEGAARGSADETVVGAANTPAGEPNLTP